MATDSRPADDATRSRSRAAQNRTGERAEADLDDDRAETVSAPGTAVGSILATIAGSLVLALGVGVLVPAVVAAVTGCLLTATVTATKRRTPGGRAVGSVLAVLAATGLVAAIGLAASGAGATTTLGAQVGVVLAIALAAFGATATVTGAIGDGAVGSAVPVAVFTSVPLAATAALFTDPVRSLLRERLVGGAVSGTGAVGSRLLEPASAGGSVASFVALLVALCWLLAVVLTRLPIPELTPRDRRAVTRQRVEGAAAQARVGGVVLLLAGGIAFVVAAAEDAAGAPYLEEVYPPLESAILSVASAGWLRVAIVAGIATLLVLFALSKLPGLSRLRQGTLATWGPVFTGGILASVLVIVVYPPLFEGVVRPPLEATLADGDAIPVPIGGGPIAPEQLLSTLEPPGGIAIGAVAMTAVVGTIVSVLLSVSVLGAIRLLPRRAAPGAFGASALVAGGICAAVAGAGPLVVGLAVVCAIVAWDGAVYGVSITEELGRETPVRLPAVAHVTGSAVVGLLGVGLALGLGAGLESVAVSTGITIALSLVVALILVVVVLKRRTVRHQSSS